MTAEHSSSNKLMRNTWLLLGASSAFILLGAQNVKAVAIDSPSTTTATPSNSNSTINVDTGWNWLGGNTVEQEWTTHYKHVNSSNQLYADAQYAIVFQGVSASEDISNGTFTVGTAVPGQTTPNSTYYSGSFQQFNEDGHTYYGIYLPNSAIRLMAKNTPAGQQAVINFQGGPSNALGFDYVSFGDGLIGEATATLPTVTVGHSNNKASTYLVGQNVTVKDNSNGDTLTTMKVTSDDVTVTNDSSDTGQYAYALSTTGLNKLNAKLANLESTTGIKYSLVGSPTGSVTIKPAESLTGTFKYVDDTNTTVETRTTNALSGQQQTYQVVLPAGYELATGQVNSLDYTLMAGQDNTFMIHVKKIETPATTNQQTDQPVESSNSATNDNASDNKVVQPVNAKTMENTNPNSSKSRQQQFSTVAVQYIDTDSGSILDSEQFIGIVGQPIPFDTMTVLSHFFAQRYLVQQDDTNMTKIFTQGHTNLRVMLKHLPKPSQSRNKVIPLFPKKQTTTGEDANTQQKTAKAPTNTLKQKSKKTKGDSTITSTKPASTKKKQKITKTQTQQPAVINNALTQINGDGGSGSGDSHSYLAQYFIALSGTINF